MLQFCIIRMYVVSIVFFAFGRVKLALIVMNTKQLVTGGEIAGTAATDRPNVRSPKGAQVLSP